MAYFADGKPKSQLDLIDLECVLFLDIETVPAYKNLALVPERLHNLWLQRAKRFKSDKPEETDEDIYFQNAGLFAEFGKIICISAGFFRTQQTGEQVFRIKSFYSHNEAELLIDFRELLIAHFNNCNNNYLCAHNGTEFDFPYLAKRMMIKGLQLPSLLNISGSKSWNNRWLIDTMELWRFGDYKDKVSLDLLAACFDVATPKDDISGKDVAKVFYNENNLERIKEYCQKDIATMAQIFRKMMGLTPVAEGDVIYL